MNSRLQMFCDAIMCLLLSIFIGSQAGCSPGAKTERELQDQWMFAPKDWLMTSEDASMFYHVFNLARSGKVHELNAILDIPYGAMDVGVTLHQSNDVTVDVTFSNTSAHVLTLFDPCANLVAPLREMYTDNQYVQRIYLSNEFLFFSWCRVLNPSRAVTCRLPAKFVPDAATLLEVDMSFLSYRVVEPEGGIADTEHSIRTRLLLQTDAADNITNVVRLSEAQACPFCSKIFRQEIPHRCEGSTQCTNCNPVCADPAHTQWPASW